MSTLLGPTPEKLLESIVPFWSKGAARQMILSSEVFDIKKQIDKGCVDIEVSFEDPVTRVDNHVEYVGQPAPIPLADLVVDFRYAVLVDKQGFVFSHYVTHRGGEFMKKNTDAIAVAAP